MTPLCKNYFLNVITASNNASRLRRYLLRILIEENRPATTPGLRYSTLYAEHCFRMKLSAFIYNINAFLLKLREASVSAIFYRHARLFSVLHAKHHRLAFSYRS